MRWLGAMICGFLIWFVPATLDFLLYPSMVSIRNLLDALLIVALVLMTIVCTVRYFKTTEGDFLMEGIEIGALWFLIAIAMGLLVSFAFPGYTPRIGTQVTPLSVFMNVGVFFLLVPVITIAFGYIIGNKMLETR